MLYKKQGFPEEDELVLCTITSVQSHSVFATLDEYDNRSGMIHISEVSPGRIRNIRDFVVEGKKIVCKVLKIDEKKGHIDLSLRRVNESQKRAKLDQIKQEQKAEKIIEMLARELKKPVEEIYKQIADQVLKKYERIHEYFDELVIGKTKLELNLDKNLIEKLASIVKEKIKIPEVQIKGVLTLTSYAPNGIEIIKEAIKKAEEKGDNKLSIKYAGAGKYKLLITAPDYKEAEKIIKSSVAAAEKVMEKNDSFFEFEREE
jgi:translation initiation factor 2 subunit 1